MTGAKRTRRIAWLVTMLAIGGCGGTADPFVGTWSCSGSETTTYTMPANMPAATDTTGASVTITDDGTGALTIVRTPNNGGPMCTVHAHLGGDAMSFSYDAGQTCLTKTGNTVGYTSHMATKTATGYSTTSTWTVSGTTSTGAPLAGSGMGTGNCTKT